MLDDVADLVGIEAEIDGTRIRPKTLTPKRLARKRPALGETMATRSPSPTSRSSTRARPGCAHVPELPIRDAAEAAAGIGLSIDRHAAAGYAVGALEEIGRVRERSWWRS